MTLDGMRTLKHEKGGKLQLKSGPVGVPGFWGQLSLLSWLAQARPA